MPKFKTHSGAKKRFKVSGTGKLLHEAQNNQHLFEHKSSRRKRSLDGTFELAKADRSRVKKMLGI